MATVLISATASADPFAAEAWVEKCKIKTAKMLERDAAAIGGGINFKPRGKALWAPAADGAEGVLIVHPVAKDKPAEIEYSLAGAMTDRSKTLVITARGSNEEPGVALTVSAKGKPIKEAALNKKWVTIEIPLSEVPLGTTSLKLEFFPVLWKFEYCYVDVIELR